MRIQIPKVTLVAPTGEHIPETITAIQRCCENVDFGAVKLITHEKPDNLPENIIFEKSLYPMDTYEKYNNYVFKELTNHVTTSHCLLIQYDSWVIHPEVWDDKWLEYDYIGAPWQIKENGYIAWSSGERVRVGNGGFSLRSKKLLDIPNDCKLPLVQEQGYYNEDGNICCYHRVHFLAMGIKYAPVEIAIKFSYENRVPEYYGGKTFGFHKNYPPHISIGL